MFKSFFVVGCIFNVCAFITAPAQTVQVRLFEIFHLRRIEISPTAFASTQVLPASKRAARSEAPNRLHLFSTKDSPSFISPSGIHIELLQSGIQIHSADFSGAVSRRDTINLTATGGYFFARISSATSSLSRRYAGALKIFTDGQELGVVNVVPAEDYLAGVLAAEMPNADLAALQAQAVVSRTYMVKNQQRHSKNGCQFCDLTHCQTYKGMSEVTPVIRQAVASTADEILTFAEQPIDAYFSSTCGGATADDNGVWANADDQPYLKSVVDNFCANSPHYRWRALISADSLHQIWQRRLGEPIQSIAITQKGRDGRVRELALMGHSLHLISGEDFRAVTCRRFGWNTLKSTAFDLWHEKNSYVFDGRGLGHGLGLCQYGAMEMARRGYSYREILARYFPGTEIRKYDE